MPIVSTAAAASARGWGMMLAGVSGPTPPFKLYTWGYNTAGQLGLGNTTNYSSPKQVGSLLWNDVSCGQAFTAAIRSDGTMWCWGTNASGQLGDGTTVAKSSPVQVGALTTWARVWAGSSFCLATRTDGTLWAWGYNGSGGLGDGTTVNKSSPVQVGALTDWGGGTAKAANVVTFLKADGTLWSWGSGVYGGLGDGTATPKSSPVQIGALSDWVGIGGGRSFGIAARSNGTLWAWGRNNYGQLGDGTTVDKSSPIQVGALTNWSGILSTGSMNVEGGVFAVKTDGTLWAWGAKNNYGQLGDGTTLNRSSPVQIGALTQWNTNRAKTAAVQRNSQGIIRDDGTMWGTGRGSGVGFPPVAVSSPVQIGSGTKWAFIAAGGYFGAALTK